MTPDASIEIAFELTPADAGAFAEFWPTHDPVFLRQMRSSRVALTIIFALIALTVVALGVVGTTATLWLVAFVFALAAGLSWFTWPGQWRSALRKQMMRRFESGPASLAFGPRRYVIDAEAVRFSGAYSGGYVRWPAVTEVVAGPAAVYIAVGGQAHIVPRRAFAAPADFDAFVALAERYRAAAVPPEAVRPTR